MYACYKYLQICSSRKSEAWVQPSLPSGRGLQRSGRCQHRPLLDVSTKRGTAASVPPLHQDGVLLQRAHSRGRCYLLYKAAPEGFAAARMPGVENRDRPG